MATLPPAVNGTEQRLDLILAELRAIRTALEQSRPQPAPAPEPPAIALREPARAAPTAPAKTKRR